MKMRIRISHVVEIDLAKEEKRLKKCFKGKQLKRQMVILEAFKKGDWNHCADLIQVLPSDPQYECSEAEYIGLDIYDTLVKGVLDGENLEILK